MSWISRKLRVDFGLNDFTDVLIYSRRYWHIAEYPRFVFHDGHDDGREEVFAEAPSLRVVPREAFVLNAHEVVHERALLRPKEVASVNFVDDCAIVGGISACGSERRGNGG